MYVEHSLTCLKGQVRYPLPLLFDPSTWDTGFNIFVYYRGALEAGNIASADNVEARCFCDSWHRGLQRLGLIPQTKKRPKDCTLRAIANALILGFSGEYPSGLYFGSSLN
jgi:hypothetical protein